MPLHACLCAVSVSALLGSSGSEDKRKQHEDAGGLFVLKVQDRYRLSQRATKRKTDERRHEAGQATFPSPEVPQFEQYIAARWSLCVPMYLLVHRLLYDGLEAFPSFRDTLSSPTGVQSTLGLRRQSRHRETIAFEMEPALSSLERK
ncbi:hypothetical protein LY78DRAFT_733417 [Colletotrichum sublineola]|nr:hypothetical protein LY78DRAFT_733417 [Colletotrichum sublineola]